MGSFAASGIILAVSRLNYPGADALNRLHALVPQHRSHQQRQYLGGQGERMIVTVHMDTLSCMTGITRFLQLPAPPLADLENGGTEMGNEAKENLFWVYDKTEEEERLLDPVFWERFDWVLAENPKRVIGKWEVVETVEGYAGLKVLRPRDDGGGDVKSGGGGIEAVVEMVKKGDAEGMWRLLERYGRMATGGWWVGVRMEPRIAVLKRQRNVPVLPLGGDW